MFEQTEATVHVKTASEGKRIACPSRGYLQGEILFSCRCPVKPLWTVLLTFTVLVATAHPERECWAQEIWSWQPHLAASPELPAASPVIPNTTASPGILVPALWEGIIYYPSALVRSVSTPVIDPAGFGVLQSQGVPTAALLQVLIHGGNPNRLDHLCRQHPEWLSTDINGETQLDGVSPSLLWQDGFFIDPGAPRFREFLLGIVTEVMQVLEPDWLILDQLRYPIADPVPYGQTRLAQPWGYHPWVRDAFESKWQIDPLSLVQGFQKQVDGLGRARSIEVYEAWQDWRRGLVTDLLRAVVELLRDQYPDCQLAVTVIPDPMLCREVALQPWRDWVASGWLDAVVIPAHGWPEWTFEESRELDELGTSIWTTVGSDQAMEEIVADRENVAAWVVFPEAHDEQN